MPIKTPYRSNYFLIVRSFLKHQDGFVRKRGYNKQKNENYEKEFTPNNSNPDGGFIYSGFCST
jgi:hypothetical protein